MSDRFEAGAYTGEIVKVSISKSSQAGTPQVVFACKLIDHTPLTGGDPVPVELPYERSVIRYLTDNAIDILLRDLESLGYDRESFDELETAHPNHFPFEGKRVPLRLKYEQYKGKDQERWEFGFGGGMVGKPVERKDMVELNARFGSHLKKRGAAPRPAAAAAGKSTEDQADEVF